MKNLIRFSSVAIFLCLAFQISTAQIASTDVGPNADNLNSVEVEYLDQTDENWTFYRDEETNTFYIDFESISVTLSEIIVKGSNGEAIFTDDVLSLPVNTIYELDCSSFGSGKYTVELHSYTKILKKDIKVQ